MDSELRSLTQTSAPSTALPRCAAQTNPYLLQGDTEQFDATFKLDVAEATNDTEETVLLYRAVQKLQGSRCKLIDVYIELDPRCDGKWWHTGAQLG